MPNKDPRLFPILPAETIEQLKPYGTEVIFEPLDALFVDGDKADTLYVILEGQVKVTRKAGNEEMTLVIHEPGEFTGELSLISGGRSIATGRALGIVRALKIPTQEMGRAFTEHLELRKAIVPVMAARRPEADARVMQREKLAALGKMSAGLAHELNNPAAAATRAASQLGELITNQLSEALNLGETHDDLLPAKMKSIIQCVRTSRRGSISALELSDREETMCDWLSSRNVPDAWKLAGDLAAAGITVDDLNKFAGCITDETRLIRVLHWLATSLTALNLVDQIETSTGRMSELVKAIKSFTYMDQMPIQEVNVQEGLESTLTILGHKLKNIKVIREYDPKLPCVTGRGGDLNQVWSNIIDNAIDAMEGHGEITIRTSCEIDQALIQITDNGPGIPPDVQPHIFEPFFTTKGIGEGTGLGLDSVYRIIVDQHRGDIRVDSKPGRTTFEVRLPVVDGTCPGVQSKKANTTVNNLEMAAT